MGTHENFETETFSRLSGFWIGTRRLDSDRPVFVGTNLGKEESWQSWKTHSREVEFFLGHWIASFWGKVDGN